MLIQIYEYYVVGSWKFVYMENFLLVINPNSRETQLRMVRLLHHNVAPVSLIEVYHCDSNVKAIRGRFTQMIHLGLSRNSFSVKGKVRTGYML